MSNGFYRHLTEQLSQVQAEGLYKQERIITSAQQAQIAPGHQQRLTGGEEFGDLIGEAHGHLLIEALTVEIALQARQLA